MNFRKYNEGRPEDGSSRLPFMGSKQPISPDPVEIVRQYEEDENLARILQEYQAFDYMEQDHYLEESARVARQLQAEFDSEILAPPHSIESPRQNDTTEIVTSEDNVHDVGFNDDPELTDEIIRDFEPIDLEQSEVEDDEIDDEEIGDEEEDNPDDEEEEDNPDDEEEEDNPDDDGDDDGEEEDQEEENAELDRSRLFPEEIDRLPTHFSATSLTSRSEAKMCQICMESYATGDKLRMLPCFHEFHTICIDPWLLKSTTCPVCRIKVDLTGRVSCFF